MKLTFASRFGSEIGNGPRTGDPDRDLDKHVAAH